jgi:hypothetical protein
VRESREGYHQQTVVVASWVEQVATLVGNFVDRLPLRELVSPVHS